MNKNLKNEFERNGYAIVRNFIDHETINSLKQHIEKLAERNDFSKQSSIFSSTNENQHSDDYFLKSGNKICFFLEEDYKSKVDDKKIHGVNKIGHALHDLDSLFHDFCYSDKIQSLFDQINLQTPAVISSMYICKPPKIGGKVEYHQDSTFLYHKYKDVIGLWFAFDDATEENGCLYALPEGHKTHLRQKYTRCDQSPSGFKFEDYDDKDWIEEDAIALTAQKGDLILLHGLLPHFSPPNLSHKQRHAFAIHIVDGLEGYEEGNWIQRKPVFPFKEKK